MLHFSLQNILLAQHISMLRLTFIQKIHFLTPYFITFQVYFTINVCLLSNITFLFNVFCLRPCGFQIPHYFFIP